MIRVSGKCVGKGIAIGRLYLYEKENAVLNKRLVEDEKSELDRFEEARKEAARELSELYEKARKEIGGEEALIFEIHSMMLQDESFLDSIRDAIFQGHVNAEYAVHQAGESFAEAFASMEDEYMNARSADVLDIAARLVRILTGFGGGSLDSAEPVILLAEDLSPSETVQMDKNKLLAIVTRKGSANSHTAILARSMNIPALVQTEVELKPEYHGKRAVVDAGEGTLLIEPTEELLEAAVKKKMEADRYRSGLEELKGKENITSDGRSVDIFANIGSASDARLALREDAGGIGLFRSEFLYLGRGEPPSEEEQYEIYKEVFSCMEGKKVVIRTLDIGADKQVDYLGLKTEENPAMGFRAIRLCLSDPELLRTQLRAIYRAAVYGNAAVMFPMIISEVEIRQVKKLAGEVRESLLREGRAVGEVELGIMIETPAAALISDILAGEVDFFSIGTNDLTQYTLAIDRQNEALEPFYDPHHEAVLRLIRMTVENAHRAGIWAGICGELAADTSLTEAFLDMEVDELSVSVSSVLEVRRAVRAIGQKGEAG